MIDRGIVEESRRVRVARRHAHLPVDAALDRAVAPGRGEHGGALDGDRALDARDGGVPVRLRSVRKYTVTMRQRTRHGTLRRARAGPRRFGDPGEGGKRGNEVAAHGPLTR